MPAEHAKARNIDPRVCRVTSPRGRRMRRQRHERGWLGRGGRRRVAGRCFATGRVRQPHGPCGDLCAGLLGCGPLRNDRQPSLRASPAESSALDLHVPAQTARVVPAASLRVFATGGGSLPMRLVQPGLRLRRGSERPLRQPRRRSLQLPGMLLRSTLQRLGLRSRSALLVPRVGFGPVTETLRHRRQLPGRRRLRFGR